MNSLTPQCSVYSPQVVKKVLSACQVPIFRVCVTCDWTFKRNTTVLHSKIEHRCCILAYSYPPIQQTAFIVMWSEKYFLDFYSTFGAASSPGVFGHIADTLIALYKSADWKAVKKWADDLIFFWYPCTIQISIFIYNLSLDNINLLAEPLGWPWKLSKTHPFLILLHHSSTLNPLWLNSPSTQYPWKCKMVAAQSLPKELLFTTPMTSTHLQYNFCSRLTRWADALHGMTVPAFV